MLILDSELGGIWGDFDRSSDLQLSITGKYKEEYGIPKGFGAVPIKERELYPPYTESAVQSDVFLFEVARLKTQGQLYYGEYSLDEVPMPTTGQLVETSLRFNEWFENEFLVERPLEKLTITESINCLVGDLQGLILVDSGRVEFNKFRLLEIAIDEYGDCYDSTVLHSVLDYISGKDVAVDIGVVTKTMEEVRYAKICRMREYIEATV